jgi:hypothetical protein
MFDLMINPELARQMYACQSAYDGSKYAAAVARARQATAQTPAPAPAPQKDLRNDPCVVAAVETVMAKAFSNEPVAAPYAPGSDVFLEPPKQAANSLATAASQIFGGQAEPWRGEFGF